MVHGLLSCQLSASSSSRIVTHDIPIKVIPRRLWKDLQEPSVPDSDVSDRSLVTRGGRGVGLHPVTERAQCTQVDSGSCVVPEKKVAFILKASQGKVGLCLFLLKTQLHLTEVRLSLALGTTWILGVPGPGRLALKQPGGQAWL